MYLLHYPRWKKKKKSFILSVCLSVSLCLCPSPWQIMTYNVSSIGKWEAPLTLRLWMCRAHLLVPLICPPPFPFFSKTAEDDSLMVRYKINFTGVATPLGLQSWKPVVSQIRKLADMLADTVVNSFLAAFPVPNPPCSCFPGIVSKPA